MTVVKLSSALPDDHGLAAVAEQLIGEPDRLHVVVALVKTKKLTTDVDSGEVDPTAHIKRIEVVAGDSDETKRLMQIMRRQHERRTGNTVLPLDLEDDLRSVFGEHVDPDTGEIGGTS